MPRVHGTKPSNAEMMINYTTKRVSFNHPGTIKDDTIWFMHNITIYLALIVGALFFSFTMPETPLRVVLGIQPDTIRWTGASIIYLIAVFFSSIIIFGYVSVFSHRQSKWLRDNFGRTNAVIYRLTHRRWKHVTFAPEKVYGAVICGTTLILPDYSILSFEFEYEGDAVLQKLETRSVEKADKKGDHFRFMALFHFDAVPTCGTLRYR